MKYSGSPQYDQAYLEERSGLVDRIQAEFKDDNRPTITGWLIDDANTVLCEQAISVLETEDGIKAAYSVVDTSFIPPLGKIEQLGFRRLETEYVDERVYGGRLFGDDATLHAALNLKQLRSARAPVAPALTFIFDEAPEAPSGLQVIAAEKTFFRRNSQTIARSKSLDSANNPELQQLRDMFPDLATAAEVEALLERTANEWVREQLDGMSVPAFGQPAVIHRPMREWASFKNTQALDGVLFDGEFPLYTPEQVELIDDIVSRKVKTYDVSAIEPVVAVSSILKLLHDPDAGLSAAQRESVFDVLFDLDTSERRKLGFVRHAGRLAAQKGLIDLAGKDPASIEPTELADQLIVMVQKHIPLEEQQVIRNKSVLIGLGRTARDQSILGGEPLRRLAASMASRRGGRSRGYRR